jgi:hypothetical protein
MCVLVRLLCDGRQRFRRALLSVFGPHFNSGWMRPVYLFYTVTGKHMRVVFTSAGWQRPESIANGKSGHDVHGFPMRT